MPRRSTDSGLTTNRSNTPITLVSRNSISEANGLNLFPELEGKDGAQQLELLNAMLEKENRIKEGAENLLKVQLKDALRSEVESELELANNKIDAILKRIEASSSRGLRKTPSGTRIPSPVIQKRKLGGQGPTPSARHREDNADKDDFRNAKQQASALIKTLSAYARQNLTPTSASSASSSSSTSPLPTTEQELDRARTETMARLIVILQKNMRVAYEVDVSELIQIVMPALSDRASKKSRATAYRLIRHVMIDIEAVERFQEHHLDWFIVKSLARDNKYAIEREQVIKLIRAIVEVGSERRAPHTSAGSGTVPLSEAIMRALISVAEQVEDPFRNICCQTLIEILLIDIDLMAKTGGIRVLLQSLSEGPVEIGPILATAFLYIVDAPKTRAYLHPGTDIEIALSGITDAYGKGAVHGERMRVCSKVISVMLRTWSGIMYLCMNDMLAIRTMINTLRIPSLETREIVLDMFFELLNIKAPEWYQTFIDGRRLTMYRRQRPASNTHKEHQNTNREPRKLKLTDQYISLLTLILTKAGLIEALTAMLEEAITGSNLSRKAMLLMGEVLQIANQVLPLEIAAKIQTIPRIFDLAADYTQGEHFIVGTSALSAIDSFNRNKARLQPGPVKDVRQRANSVEDPVRRGQRQVEQVKIKLGMQMDDRAFQATLLETQVMLTKDHTKWNFDTLSDLIEGPLLNPKRLEEAIKVSKFVKRLMSFFHPFSHRFADIKKSKSNLRWIKLGCSLLTTLMTNPDGVKYLANEDDFLPQIAKSFIQLDPFNGSPDSDPIFSKKRVEETLTAGYLDMLGTLSKQKDGIELMEKFKIFTVFYHLSELRSREDLIKGIIENIDYTIDGHPRIVLSKALTSSYKHIRLYATKHLGKLIQGTAKANAWTLRLLLTQLYDPAMEVCKLAVDYLEEACESSDILKVVVDMQPTLEHLGEIGHPLLMKFMSTPVGFRYLYDVGYIDREMDMWLHERNFHYVVEVEVYLSRELNFNPMEDDDDDTLAFDGTVPPHFYGEMAKTDLGCQVLHDKGHFADFAHFIRQHGLESEDFEIILKLKSILWAVGNIAATEGGLPFLEEEEIVPAILEIAEQSPVLSVRGTCFYALGLVSSTAQGAEILDDYGWGATLSPLGSPTGLCIPIDVERFVSIPPWKTPSFGEEDTRRLVLPTQQAEVEVMTAIHNLANTVIANAASRSLAKLKTRPEYRSVFSSPSLFYRVLHTISTQRYRLPVRRYILDLFDIQLDSNVIKTLIECEKTLTNLSKHTTSPKVMKLQPRVVSIFGPNRGRRASESDGEDDLDDEEDTDTVMEERPVSLQPVKRIVGFD
ncbi:hypothetical protein BD410DRAFT_858667 [Rickenella mellea]|uniref:REM-1 domain-containing protein n=1 Tax=Rickenella mellea TaxID=50990 RepID=A0A4Y7Q7J8_9AGAM|nr:hypothetical protein BD410DRAFT_858667 [Rickenella mellea]